MTYAEQATEWLAAGFGPLPLPAGQKYPPPAGWTGAGAPMPSAADVAAWVEDQPGANVALRLPADVVALDVDAYDGRPGWATLCEHAARLGGLPPTWRITARDDGRSGHLLYRLPAGSTSETFVPQLAGGGVDVLRAGHRYSIAPGSLHPSGARYVSHGPDGGPTDKVPAVGDLPELSLAWVEALARPATPSPDRGVVAVAGQGRVALTDAECRRLDRYTEDVVRREVGRLQACAAAATAGGVAYRGDPWQATTYAVACSLLELGNAGWSSLTLDRAAELVTEHAPRDAGFGSAEVSKALRSAQSTVRGKARAMPVDRTPPTTGGSGPVDPFEDPTGGVWAAGPATTSPARPRGGQRVTLDVTNEAVAARHLAANLGGSVLPGTFQRSGELVHCPRIGEDGYEPPATDGDDDGPAQVRPMHAGGLAAALSLGFDCERQGKDGQARPALFPRTAAQTVVDAPDRARAVRVLRGVTHTPVVRVDGTLLIVPGYDQASGLLYLPDPGLTLPAVRDHPTTDDVQAAVLLLGELVGGFPFVSAADHSNFLGLLLTPLLRLLAPPPYKLGAIGAPSPGSGKTLLATLLRIVHGGVFRSEWPGDDAELRKSVTAILDVTTGPVVHFDNVTGVLRSSTLAGLLTSARWDDRRLGATAMVSARNDRLWVVTGNNLALGGDLARRTVHVTVDPGVPDPHLRTDFRIGDLEGWTTSRRGEILVALLTLIRHWVVSGRPVRPARSSDGFALWVQTVDGILGMAGFPGRFDDAAAAPEPVGHDDQEWSDFLRAVHTLQGSRPWTAREVLAMVNTSTTGAHDVARPLPVDALPGELVEKLARSGAGASSLAKTLGMWLRNRAGRWAGGYTVRAAGKDRNGVASWVVATHAPATSGQVVA